MQFIISTLQAPSKNLARFFELIYDGGNSWIISEQLAERAVYLQGKT